MAPTTPGSPQSSQKSINCHRVVVKVMSGIRNSSPLIKKKVQDFVSTLHISVVLFVIIMQWNMPNCAVIIFGYAFIQRNHEHIQKQEDQWKMNDLCWSQCANFANLVILSLDFSDFLTHLETFFKSLATKYIFGQTLSTFWDSPMTS